MAVTSNRLPMEFKCQQALWLADPDDPDEDPGFLFLASAKNGSIYGMEKALSQKPEVFVFTDPLDGKYALHFAAASFAPDAVDAVRWLLNKGFPWCAMDRSGRLAEDWARMHNNESCITVLRNWAIEFEYKLYYLSNHEEVHPDADIPFGDIVRSVRLDGDKENTDFCNSVVRYIHPRGAPEDEVALVTGFNETGVMMEWERPIMRETARLLVDGMPATSLRILNIGFGIGMIDTYFQDAQPAEHIIIEGHSTCLGWMRHKGWYDRPGVRILEGRWQDFFPSNSESPDVPNIGKFDIVYFDTFQEGYSGHVAFIKNVPALLRGPGSRFSYFNGHGRGGEIMYQVFMEVARLHHNDLGMNTEYFPVYVDPNDRWYNLQDLDKGIGFGRLDPELQYTIPICVLAPTVPRRIVANVGWNNKPQPEL